MRKNDKELMDYITLVALVGGVIYTGHGLLHSQPVLEFVRSLL